MEESTDERDGRIRGEAMKYEVKLGDRRHEKGKRRKEKKKRRKKERGDKRYASRQPLLG
jgi:hypothetical protein